MNKDEKQEEFIVLLSTVCLRGAAAAGAAVVPLISIKFGDVFDFLFNISGWEVEICTGGENLF